MNRENLIQDIFTEIMRIRPLEATSLVASPVGLAKLRQEMAVHSPYPELKDIISTLYGIPMKSDAHYHDAEYVLFNNDKTFLPDDQETQLEMFEE